MGYEHIDEKESKIIDVEKDVEKDLEGEGGDEYENKLTDDALEAFVDGLLITLGEMEMSGRIPKIESPSQAHDALLGVIRKLYTRRSVIRKMARKFARFGAKQFLRKQRTALSKSVS
jgi:hypothetical protein